MSESFPASPAGAAPNQLGQSSGVQELTAEGPTSQHNTGQLDAPIHHREIHHYIISEVELEDLEAGARSADSGFFGGLLSIAVAFCIAAWTVSGLAPGVRGFFWGVAAVCAVMMFVMGRKVVKTSDRAKELARRVRSRPSR